MSWRLYDCRAYRATVPVAIERVSGKCNAIGRVRPAASLFSLYDQCVTPYNTLLDTGNEYSAYYAKRN